MELAPHIDHMVLFSGDGDFRSLVEAVQRGGIRVTVVSSMTTRPPMVADELRRQADVFIEIADLKDKIGRSQPDRPARDRRVSHEFQTPEFLRRGSMVQGAMADDEFEE